MIAALWRYPALDSALTIANYDVLPDGAFVMTEAEPGSPRLTVVLTGST